MYHTQFHSFPDTDPNAVNASLDALRERFGMHAQLEKQRALDRALKKQKILTEKNKARSFSNWSPYDRVRVVNAIP